MGNLLHFFELVAVASWFGAIVFFSFCAAPALFHALDRETAAKAVRSIFPVYYLAAMLCGVILTAVNLFRGVLWYWGGMIRPSIALFAILTMLSVYARQRLIPAIDRARDAGPLSKKQFDQLHRRSVQFNVLFLLCLIAYLVWMSIRGY